MEHINIVWSEKNTSCKQPPSGGRSFDGDSFNSFLSFLPSLSSFFLSRTNAKHEKASPQSTRVLLLRNHSSIMYWWNSGQALCVLCASYSSETPSFEASILPSWLWNRSRGIRWKKRATRLETNPVSCKINNDTYQPVLMNNHQSIR